MLELPRRSSSRRKLRRAAACEKGDRALTGHLDSGGRVGVPRELEHHIALDRHVGARPEGRARREPERRRPGPADHLEAPLRASSCATALPMPEAPPVTIAT